MKEVGHQVSHVMEVFRHYALRGERVTGVLRRGQVPTYGDPKSKTPKEICSRHGINGYAQFPRFSLRCGRRHGLSIPICHLSGDSPCAIG